MKKLILGLGTGRCGTHSLKSLLNLQESFNVTHEMGDVPFMPWDFNKSAVDLYISKILSYEGQNCGDVAFWILPYVEYIISKYPHSKFICLKRNKKETIASFSKKTKKRNHWQHHIDDRYNKCPWDKCFPKYSCESKKKKHYHFIMMNTIINHAYWQKNIPTT